VAKLPTRRPRRRPTVAEQLFDTTEGSLLDVVDRLLNKGVVASGDVTLGVAGVDLIYLRLSALLCAADRVLPPNPERGRGRAHREPRRRFRL